MTLQAELTVSRDAFTLDIDLTASPGEVVALLGPNAAGKSTALRALAGLQPLTAGSVVVDSEVLEDTTRRIRVPAQRRPVGVVFQDYLLFPHLSALENVAFGLRARGTPRAQAHDQARQWLDRVGLTAQAEAKPRRLSGGQAQRVALARALAVTPRLLLFDEPLAALDASTRLEVRSDLRHHLRAYLGMTVLVTHDPIDALVLADQIVVIEDGRVVQRGDPTDITRRPRTDYVARLVGLNLYRGIADRDRVTLRDGGHLITAHMTRGEVFVAFRPSAVALHRTAPDGSPRNTWPTTVTAIEAHGDTVRVRLDGAPPVLADVTPAAVAELDLLPGRRVWAAVKATETNVYPA